MQRILDPLDKYSMTEEDRYNVEMHYEVQPVNTPDRNQRCGRGRVDFFSPTAWPIELNNQYFTLPTTTPA